MLFFPVWQRLEKQNEEFFKVYNLSLLVKNQITEFNRLLSQQVMLMHRSGLTGISPVVISNGYHVSPSKTTFLRLTHATKCKIAPLCEIKLYWYLKHEAASYIIVCSSYWLLMYFAVFSNFLCMILILVHVSVVVRSSDILQLSWLVSDLRHFYFSLCINLWWYVADKECICAW